MSLQNSFNAGFNLFKQKTLHMVSKVVDLEKVGLHKHVAIDDPMFEALYANVMKLQKVLKSMLASVEEFEKAVDGHHKLSVDLCDALSNFSGPDDQYKVSRLVSPYRQTINYLCVNGLGHTCRGEVQKLLKERVKDIIVQNLALIKDIRERVQLRGITTYELQTIQTSLERKRSNSSSKIAESQANDENAGKSMSALEDQLADKEREYDQMNAGLFQQLSAVNEQRFELVAKLFQAFKECQLQFFKASSTAMEENVLASGPSVEEISNMPCPVISSEMKTGEVDVNDETEVIDEQENTENKEKKEEEIDENENENEEVAAANVEVNLEGEGTTVTEDT